MDANRPPEAAVNAAAGDVVNAWLSTEVESLSQVRAIETLHDDVPRWFVRLETPERGVFSVWLWLAQRRLHVEVYLAPAPIEQRERLFEFLLKRAARLMRCRLCIAAEDGIYVRGSLAVEHVDPQNLDALFGEAVQTVEELFVPVMRIGYASQFRG